jgi:hypothetical protein
MTEKPLLLLDVDGPPLLACTLDECRKPLIARGMCGMHYRRWRIHGDPRHVDVIRGDTEKAFWSHVEKGADGECWLWTAACCKNGYGKIQVGGKTLRAHVWAYVHFVGPIPEGLQLDHVKAAGCTNLNCVNFVRHLEPVTALENILRSNGVAAKNARKTHCDRGHEFTPENIYWQGPKRNNRECLTCRRLLSPQYAKARRERSRREAVSAH